MRKGHKEPKTLNDVRKALAEAYVEIADDPGKAVQVREINCVLGRMISTVSAAVAYGHLTKKRLPKSCDRFVRG